MPLPNFILVGVARSGTTSLHKCLEQHPDIFMPFMQEVHFFNDGWPYWVRTIDEYKALFNEWKGEKAIGETSPKYFTDSNVPKKIKDTLGPIKILIILRNPADRAFSMWCLNYYKRGEEKLSFTKALLAEEERSSSEKIKNLPSYYPGMFQYFSEGLYVEKIKLYVNVFGQENIKVIIFEEFIEAPEKICKEIYDFLGVDSSFTPVVEHLNQSTEMKSRLLNRLIIERPKFIDWIYYSMPIPIKKSIFMIGTKLFFSNQKLLKKEKKEFSFEIRQELLKRYAPSIRKLESLLGRDLSVWTL